MSRDGGASRSLRRTKTMRGRTTTATARTLGLSRRTPAGEAFPVSPPSREAFRRHVLAGICPFCGLGPYKVLASHTNKAHMVDRKELRDRAGLTYQTSITSPEFHSERSASARRLFEEGKTLKREDVAKGTRKPRELSEAAKALNREKLLAARASDPDAQRRATEASVHKKAEEMRPLYELVVSTYEAVLAERGMAYGSVAATAERLGWPTATTLRRINAAWALGLGTHDRLRRDSVRTKICEECAEPFSVTRSRGWDNKTCSRECGYKLTGRRSRKPPATIQCKICGEDFTYHRTGTVPRSLCDKDECAREVSRRAGSRTPSEETRRKISAARRRKTAATEEPC